jgi:hypothetical protein
MEDKKSVDEGWKGTVAVVAMNEEAREQRMVAGARLARGGN